jgi:hypothetical protein
MVASGRLDAGSLRDYALSSPNVLSFQTTIQRVGAPGQSQNTVTPTQVAPPQPVRMQHQAPPPQGQPQGGIWYTTTTMPQGFYIPPGGNPNDLVRDQQYWWAVQGFFTQIFVQNPGATPGGLTEREFRDWISLSNASSSRSLTPQEMIRVSEIQTKIQNILQGAPTLVENPSGGSNQAQPAPTRNLPGCSVRARPRLSRSLRRCSIASQRSTRRSTPWSMPTAR